MTIRARPQICLVTDRGRLAPEARTVSDGLLALERFLDDAIGAGVDVIQIRERDVPAADLAALTARLSARVDGTDTVVLVNDRLDVALAAGASGLHLPAAGVAVAAARALAPPPFLIGRSVHAVDEAGAPGADYVIFGTVFDSVSKPGVRSQGLARLSEAVSAVTTPVWAIGGIDPARAEACAVVGAAGVAAIGLFLPEGRAPGALGPVRAVSELRRALEAGQRRGRSDFGFPIRPC